MTSLRLVDVPGSARHEGEVFACAWSPDGGFVLSAGWDGQLRLWEASSGTALTALRAGPKPLSACAFTPDGKRWAAGSMEGLITVWDGHSHQLQSQLVVHTRPISSVVFSPDGLLMGSTSWDRSVSLRSLGTERNVRTFPAHDDIVAGCRFAPDGSFLLSWSYDRSLRLWDLETLKELCAWREHKDRVTAADLSPDGLLAASGSRAGELILWDVEGRTQLNSLKVGAEVRGCFFLLDAASMLVLDATGHVALYSVPELQPQAQLAMCQPAQCGALSPSGQHLAVGGEDGGVRFVTIEGCENRPMVVTATRSQRRTASTLQKLFGRSTLQTVFACTCPACRQPLEFLERLPGEPAPCPHCRRQLRFNRKTLAVEEPATSRQPSVVSRP